MAFAIKRSSDHTLTKPVNLFGKNVLIAQPEDRLPVFDCEKVYKKSNAKLI